MSLCLGCASRTVSLSKQMCKCCRYGISFKLSMKGSPNVVQYTCSIIISRTRTVLRIGANKLKRFPGSRQSGAGQTIERGLVNAINSELNSYISQLVSTLCQHKPLNCRDRCCQSVLAKFCVLEMCSKRWMGYFTIG